MVLKHAGSRYKYPRAFSERFPLSLRYRRSGLWFGITSRQPGQGLLLLRQVTPSHTVRTRRTRATRSDGDQPYEASRGAPGGELSGGQTRDAATTWKRSREPETRLVAEDLSTGQAYGSLGSEPQTSDRKTETPGLTKRRPSQQEACTGYSLTSWISSFLPHAVYTKLAEDDCHRFFDLAESGPVCALAGGASATPI